MKTFCGNDHVRSCQRKSKSTKKTIVFKSKDVRPLKGIMHRTTFAGKNNVHLSQCFWQVRKKEKENTQ